MHDVVRKLLALFSLVTFILLALGLLIVLLSAAGLITLPLFLLLGLAYGWVLSGFMIYRSTRHDEVLQLLLATAEQGAPLAPALRAYLKDRPQGGWREFWTATLLVIAVPGYYWLWYQQHKFEHRLTRVADRLEQGDSLHEALSEVGGVMPRSTVMAVAVGESVGRLPLGLRRSNQGQLLTVWVEVLPRLLYPIVLLLFLLSIISFWMLFLMPKMQRIYRDMSVEMPEMTQWIADFARIFGEVPGLVPVLLLTLVGVPVALFLHPGLMAYVPFVRRLYRLAMQSEVLRMLGILVEANRPLPQALALLAGPNHFAPSVRRRLWAVQQAVEQGTPLAEGLAAQRLLPASMAPLVRAAERAQNLPWALAELGDLLATRAVRLTRQVSLALFPTAVFLIGIVIGVFVIGMFIPLIHLISELA